MSDPYFNNVSLLITLAQDIPGLQYFYDKSNYHNVLNPSGNVAIDKTLGKFDNASLYFDGITDRLNSGNSISYTFGTGDFTVEYWFYLKQLNKSCYVFECRITEADTGGFLFYIGSTNKLALWGNGSVLRAEGSTIVTTNTWHHAALSRVSGVTRCFLNGVQEFSLIDTTNYVNQSCIIGMDISNSNVGGLFNVCDLRVTKGIGRYIPSFPTMFTLATSAFVNDSSNVLLLHCDGANNSTSFPDSSTTTKTITPTGSTKISTTKSKFGGASAYFNGTTDYLTVTTHADFALGVSDFTIEAWVYLNSYTDGASTLIGIGVYTTGLMIRLTSYSIDVYLVSTNCSFSTIAITLSTWHHIVLTRCNSVLTAYVDGVQLTPKTSITQNIPAASIVIGKIYHASANYLDGYIDELRITKNFARYTDAFTPPTVLKDTIPLDKIVPFSSKLTNILFIKKAFNWQAFTPVSKIVNNFIKRPGLEWSTLTPNKKALKVNIIRLLRPELNAAYGGIGVLSGHVTIGISAVKRKIRLYDAKSGLLIREQWSNDDGSYTFTGLRKDLYYTVTATDYNNNYNDVIDANVLSL